MHPRTTVPSRTFGPARPLLAAPLLAVLVLAALVLAVLATAALPAAADEPDAREETVAEGPRASYLLIAEAWRSGDPEALAEMVHPDGLQVRVGKGGRATSYSPSQAFYFFKNLFRNQSTESFTYQRQQRATGPRVHAMAVWRHRETAGEPATDRRLVLVLARAGETWLLTEINSVR